MIDIIIQAAPAVVSAATLGLVGWSARRIGRFIRGFEAEHEALMESQRNQLKGSIVDRFERAEERGYVTQIELESVNRMYDSYKRLGGNHYVKALISKLNQMDVKGEIPYER